MSELLRTVIGTALWLNDTKTCVQDQGCHWPMNSTDDAPKNNPYLSASLYYGTPGTALFFSSLADALDSDGWRRVAKEALDHTVATLNDTMTAFGPNPGFYYGLSGIAYGLRAANVSSSDRARYHEAAAMIEGRILSSISPFAATPGHHLWNNTDVAHGVAGTGLFLLWASRKGEANQTQYLGALSRAASWLLDVAEGTPDGGLRWYRGVDTDGVHAGQYFPTFCCGTSGVAFFLSTLALSLDRANSGGSRLLDAAVRGADHVMSEALWRSTADGQSELLLPHEDEGEGRDLYYLGWCGGPPGWARLFVVLWQATSDRKWLDLLAAGVRATIQLVPPQLSMIFPLKPGAAPWANLGQCCGAAAAGTFLLRVASSALPLAAELKHDALTAARSIAGSIMRRATPAGPNGALAFPSPEEHAAPNNTTWQAGWMQGAAGMAAFLLHLYSIEAGTAGAGGRPLWPDEPDYWAA